MIAQLENYFPYLLLVDFFVCTTDAGYQIQNIKGLKQVFVIILIVHSLTDWLEAI